MPFTFAAQEPQYTIPVILDPGEYDFEIVDAREARTTKDNADIKKGTPVVQVKLKISGQLVMYHTFYFSNDAYWELDCLLKSIGKHPGDGEVIELDAFDLIGERGTLKLEISGSGKNEIVTFYPPCYKEGLSWPEV